MKLSKKQIIGFAITAIFLVSMLFANFYAIRKIGRYGVELYLYDKLLVAYNIAGKAGLEKELKDILSSDKMPRELALAREFKVEMETLEDPGAYLSKKVAQDKREIAIFRHSRNAAILLMFVIFSWRILSNFIRRRNKRG